MNTNGSNFRTTIQENYKRVLERIEKAALSVGRDPGTIRLVVVTKTQPIDSIQAVIDAGALDCGENYVEEAIPKIDAFRDYKAINWHMIGHVQSRKAPIVCQNFNYIHSLDCVKLAQKLSRNLEEININLPVWLEFNVSGEETKSGWDISDENKWDLILTDLDNILHLPKLIFLGLMTIPPYSEEPESTRHYFQKLRRFQEFVINHYQLSGLSELSIGMTADFEIAIQEGSTCVRIGQAIFGPRK